MAQAGDQPDGPRRWRPGGGREAGDGQIADLARRFGAETRMVEAPDGQTYLYNGRYWQRLLPATFNARLKLFCGLDMASDRFNQVKSAVLALNHDEDLQWGTGGDTEVALENGMLDVMTGTLRPHFWGDWLENVTPVVWTGEAVPSRDAPMWFGALDTWFGEDILAMDALQEFFGYVLLGHARFKKALLAVGEGDTGKSAALKVLAAMVTGGATGVGGAVCSLDPHLMDDPRALTVIKGARLNMVTELAEGKAIAATGFKKLVSTEEPVHIDEKFVRNETYIPRAKHAFAANDLPSVTEKIKPVLARLLILPFKNPIPVADRVEHFAELVASRELEGVVAWAVEGARRLIANKGVFTESGEASAVMAEIMEESNPTLEFVPGKLVEAEGFRLPVANLVVAFNRWQGGRSWSQKFLTAKLRDAGFTVSKQRPTVIEPGGPTGSVSCLIGWRWPVYDQDGAP